MIQRSKVPRPHTHQIPQRGKKKKKNKSKLKSIIAVQSQA